MTTQPLASPVFAGIDTGDLARAEAIASSLVPPEGPLVGGLKLGLQFFMAQGPAGVRRISEYGLPIFLDVKLHDIPNTVAGALASVVPLGPAFVTIHASGGREMLLRAAEAARETAARAGVAAPTLLGVTVLTSLDDDDLAAVGQATPMADQVARLADLAVGCGIGGIVCSPHEVANLRRRLGPEPILMVPGIRPAWAEAGDQKRIMTPSQALAAGASRLVIARPIIAAPDPAQAARRIAEELAAVAA